MVKGRILLAVTIVMLLLPLRAQGHEKKNYMVLKAGLYTFRSDLREADIETGFDGGLAYGRYLHRNLVLEAGGGYFHDGVNKRFGNEVKGFSVILTAKATYPFRWGELFAGGGAGVYFTKFHGEVHGNLTDAGDTATGGHLIGGANLDISRSLFIGIEGKYVFTSRADFGSLKTDLNGYTVTAGLGYRF